MYKKFVPALYVINMAFQSIFSLVSPIGIMLLIAWVIDAKTDVGPWIYVVLILVGVFSGLYSMISFILKASRAIGALEKQKTENDTKGSGKEEKNEQ
jgi:F0F1-type ATP synthase assembly protein I